jgi:GNAT superfamily N-acetyltransferase
MGGTLTIREALAGEARQLTELCLRSKRHWGYDEAFMRLAATTLVVTEGAIAMRSVLVAVADGKPAGVAALGQSGEDLELQLLFVDPSAIGLGVGRALFAAASRRLAEAGARRLLILSDPNATGFYQRMGAILIGDAPSDAIPGRLLPLLEFRTPQAGSPASGSS